MEQDVDPLNAILGRVCRGWNWEDPLLVLSSKPGADFTFGA